MAEIRLDAARIERIISQMLRDEGKLPPHKANELGSRICTRLNASMPTPTQPYLPSTVPPPPFGGDFVSAVSKKIADVDYKIASTLWELVYERGHDLPPAIADTPAWLRRLPSSHSEGGRT